MSSSRLFLAAVLFGLLAASNGRGQTPAIPKQDKLPPGAVMRIGSLRLTHGTWLTCVCFSSDDQWLGTADSDGVVRLWDVATGKLVWEKPKGTGRQLAFSPKGKMLAIGGYYSPQITLWDLERGAVVHELPQNARSLEFSKDGSMLAAAGRDRVVRLWDPLTGQLIRSFQGHEAELYAVAISPDGRLLASGGGHGGGSQHNEIRLWDISSGEQVGQLHDGNEQFKNLPDAVYSLDFSADGGVLGSAGPYVVRLWDVSRRKLAQRLEQCSYDIAFSPTLNRAAAAGDFGVYEAVGGRQVIKLSGEVGVYGCIAYSHHGGLIASGNKEGCIQLWSAETGDEIDHRTGHDGGIRSVSISPDGSLAVSMSRQDATIRVWGMASGKQLLKIPVTWRGSDVWWNEEGSEVLFAPYGREIMTWTFDSTVRYWQLGELTSRSVKVGGTSATTMAFSLDGARAAVMAYDGGSRNSVGVYELDGGTLIAELNPFEGRSSSDSWVSSMAFSPDAKTLAIGVLSDSLAEQASPSVQLWDIETGKLQRRIRSAISPPGKICFSPNGEFIATSATRGAPLQLWRPSDGVEVHAFQVECDAHGRDPAPMAFSPDGKLLAAADANRDIYVWELATWRKILTFRGHQKAVTSLVFAPDGGRLLSGSEDATMLLWSVRGAVPVAAALTPEQLQGYWRSLAHADAAIAEEASKSLLSAPDQAVLLLQDQLTAGEALDPKELPALVSALRSEEVTTQLRAIVRLKSFGIQASPSLFRALADESEAAVRRRIEGVLESIGDFPISAQALQRTRAIQLLEQLGTQDAVKILMKLAKTSPATPASRDAQAALDRLKRRLNPPKAGLSSGAARKD